MKEANPRAHLQRLITDRNYLGAQLFLQKSDVEADERDELMGMLATAVVDELSKTRRDDRERIMFLRSILAWILREIPGLGSLYREQLRATQQTNGLLPEIGRGFRNFTDVATGKKSVSEGITEAADDTRRAFEDATDRMRTEQPRERVNEFLSAAEDGIKSGLDQLGSFFRALNESEGGNGGGPDAQSDTDSSSQGTDSAARAAAKADREDDVEDAEFESSGSDDSADDVNVKRE